MKPIYAAIAALLAVAPALAAPAGAPQGPICIDPHLSYEAHWLSGSTIVAKQTFGHDHRALKISTTCIDLEGPDRIRLASTFNCVGQGDDVFVCKIDGHAQSCRISHVEPAPAATQN